MKILNELFANEAKPELINSSLQRNLSKIKTKIATTRWQLAVYEISRTNL